MCVVPNDAPGPAKAPGVVDGDQGSWRTARDLLCCVGHPLRSFVSTCAV